MALERQILTIPFAQGLDTKGDPKQLSPGKLTLLQNGVFTTGKKIRKRYGTSVKSASIFGGGTISSASTLRAFKDELLLLSSGSLYSWAAASSAWVNKGAFVASDVSRLPVGRSNAGCYYPDSISTGGISCYVYRAGTGGGVADSIKAVLVDQASGQVISTNTIAGYATRYPRVAVLAGAFIVVYWDATAAELRYRTLSLAGVMGTATTVYAAATPVDFDITLASSKLFIAYTNVGRTDIQVKSLTAAFSLSVATAFGMALAATVECVSMGEDPGTSNLMVLSVQRITAGADNTVYLSVMSAALAVVTAKVAVEATAYTGQLATAVGVDGAGTLRCWYQTTTDGVTATTGYLLRTATLTGYTPGTPSTLLRGVRMASSPATYGSTSYMVVESGSGTGKFLINALTGVAVARAGMDDGASTGTYMVPHPSVSGSVLSVALSVSASVVGSIWPVSGVDGMSVTFSTTPRMSAELGGSVLFANGLPLMYDGAQIVEHGFNDWPSTPSVVLSAGGALPEGDIGFAVVYEWLDASGAIHRSAVKYLDTVTTTAGSKTVTIKARTLTLTRKADVRVVLYRTVVTGRIYYETQTIANDTSADLVTFTEAGTHTDLQLIAQASLYATGGVLDNQPVPPLSALTVYRNRVVGISSENPNQLWYSKQVIPGEPVEFSDFLVLNMDPVGGENTALAPLDDKLLIFKAGVVYYITGSGPDNTGGQNDFSVPVLINTNSGCVEPRSVITAADGVMYQSAKGWFILDRSLQDSYIGYGVEAFNALTTRSVVQVPSTNEVRFTLSDGTILVFDFLYQQWSVFTGLAAVDSTVWGGAVHTVTVAGVVSYENPAVFTDNGTAIELRLKTGWLGAGDLQSFLRIYKLLVLGQWKSSHTLNVWIGYDYRSDNATANKFAIAATSDPSPAQFQYRVNLAQQKCEAIQVTIFDSSITGESLDLSALTFEVGTKKGPMKLPASRNA